MKEDETQAPIVLLCGRGQSSNIVFHALDDEFKVASVIVEQKESLQRFVSRRIRRQGLITTAGQCLFRAALMPILSRAARPRTQEIVRAQGWSIAPIPEHRVVAVSSVNSQTAREELRRVAPALVVVNGTRIIGRKTLAAVNTIFLNTHAGITPLYRGVHGGYWALCERRRDLVGTTVHRVDEGIDTGQIISQATFEITDNDSFATYPYLHLAAGLPLLKAAIRQALKNELQPIAPPELPSVLRTHPTIWSYVWRRLFSGVK